MIETFGILIPFLIADVLNPVLFAFMVYAAGTQRPVVTSSAVLLGHTAAYFAAGIVIALGLEKITHYLANPSSIDYLIALIVGLLLLWVAFPTAKKPETKRPEDSGSMTPLSAFGLGAAVGSGYEKTGKPYQIPYPCPDGLLVIMGDDVTVKRFRQRGAVVRLLPENPDYEPIRVDLRQQSLDIEGLGVGILRNQAL